MNPATAGRRKSTSVCRNQFFQSLAVDNRRAARVKSRLDDTTTDEDEIEGLDSLAALLANALMREGSVDDIEDRSLDEDLFEKFNRPL